jgi:hypothetical protein
MGSLGVMARCAVGLLRRPLGSTVCGSPRVPGCRCHYSSVVPAGIRTGSEQAAVPATAVSHHIEHLACTAERIARLGETGLLTNEEAGQLSEELGDCLKLHRQYLAAIEGHVAVAVTDCMQAFDSDRQLAHVLRKLHLANSSRQVALPVSEVATSPRQRRFPSEALDLPGQDELLCSIERRMHLENNDEVGSRKLTDANDIPPWPWDPLPGDESEPAAAPSPYTHGSSKPR